MPLSQLRVMATLLRLPSVNSLLTENVVELSVLVIVQERLLGDRNAAAVAFVAGVAVGCRTLGSGARRRRDRSR